MSDNNGSETGSFLAGFILGGLVGAAVAMILAPSSGEEARRKIRERGIELRDQIEDRAEETRKRAEDITGDVKTRAEKAAEEADETFQPILVAAPSDGVRNGPYVYPAGPYPHIQANKGRSEAMMWAVERKDGGRGFGFTGGHFHDNWGNDQFRKVVLNSFLWLAKAEVPEQGVESKVTKEELDLNLDPKGQKK